MTSGAMAQTVYNSNGSSCGKIENNGTESVDSLVASYTAGDKFIMNVKITKNLQNYYEGKSEEKLIESLKQTLTGYSDTDFDEFNLIFE
jgi:hypothetical protein